MGPAILGDSVEIAGFEGRVGLIDDLQLLLGHFVSAMCIGMVELDQRLVARLQAHRGERSLDLEHGQGLFASGQSTLCRLARGSAAPPAGVPRPPQALDVFDIEPPFTPVRLKARYKMLVKQHHPDAHGGDKAAEEKLKIINQAYATLKASYFN